MHTYSRKQFPFDDEWRVLADPLGVATDAEIWKQKLDKKNHNLPHLALNAFRPVRVPDDFNRQFPELGYYTGAVWYYTKLRRPAGWAGKRAFIEFAGINYNSKVYLNGELLGEHRGGFTPFSLEVTGKLTSENHMFVMVDASYDSASLPPKKHDWYDYLGITREAKLVLVPKEGVKDFSVTTKRKGKKFTCEVNFEVWGKKKNARVLVPSLDIEIDVKVNASGCGSASFPVPEGNLWTLKHPRLYSVEVAYNSDRIADDVGFRTIETNKKELLLNGEPIQLKGVAMHEEAIRCSGRSISERDLDYLMKSIRTLNANFVRLVHYPHAENIIRACDRLGILVWEEIPLTGDLDFSAKSFDAKKIKSIKDAASDILTALITRDRNRPSVITWSVMSSLPSSPKRTALCKQLVTLARKLDPTRPITASLPATLKGSSITLSDTLTSSLDILSVELPSDATSPHFENISKLKWGVKGAKPMLVSAFGAPARSGTVDKAPTSWSEKTQLQIIEEGFKLFTKTRAIKGVVVWTLADYRSAMRLTRQEDGYMRTGLMSDQGVKKMAFQFIRDTFETWREKPSKKAKPKKQELNPEEEK